MAKRDFYEVLGVARDADEADEVAYRRLAMKYHPDRNPDDPTAEQNFKEVNEAYDVLKDGQSAPLTIVSVTTHENGGGGSGPGFGGFGGGFGDIFDEVFGEFMGGRGQRQSGAAAICASTWRSAWKTPSTAVSAKSIFPPRWCARSATATAPPVETARRPAIPARARKIRAQQGFFTIERTCPTCAGTGRSSAILAVPAAAPVARNAPRPCR